MKLIYVRYLTTSLALLCLALPACSSDGGGDERPVVVMNVGGGDAGFTGCIQPNFPSDQPDLSPIDPPRFITDNSNGQLVARPGTALEAEITVNSATRYALIELKDAWSEGPAVVSTELETPGGRTLDFFLFSPPDQRFGRFYMKITLCGFDCDEQQVVFATNPDVNSPYERTVIEEGEVIQADATCVDVLPRATVVIQ
jgi:hypothetical protein